MESGRIKEGDESAPTRFPPLAAGLVGLSAFAVGGLIVHSLGGIGKAVGNGDLLALALAPYAAWVPLPLLARFVFRGRRGILFISAMAILVGAAAPLLYADSMFIHPDPQGPILFYVVPLYQLFLLSPTVAAGWFLSAREKRVAVESAPVQRYTRFRLFKLLCLGSLALPFITGGAAVILGYSEPWSGDPTPSAVFAAYALPFPVAVGMLQWFYWPLTFGVAFLLLAVRDPARYAGLLALYLPLAILYATITRFNRAGALYLWADAVTLSLIVAVWYWRARREERSIAQEGHGG